MRPVDEKLTIHELGPNKSMVFVNNQWPVTTLDPIELCAEAIVEN